GWAVAGSPARPRIRDAAERLLDGISAFGLGVQFHLPDREHAARLRLARDALAGRAAGPPRLVDHAARLGEPGLARTSARPAFAPAEGRDCAAAAVQTRSDFEDDSCVAHDERAALLLLLGYVLVSHAHRENGTADAALSGGAERRDDAWQPDLGTLF